MKKFITFIVAAFCLASSMSAQGSYYYYHGAKMPLSEDATKIVSIAPRTENITLSPSNGFTSASGLIPEQCTIGDRPVCYPIVDIGFTFDGSISITENSTATVFSDGHPVATGVLSCSNYVGKKRIQGTAVITFESPLLLPKGKTYTLSYRKVLSTGRVNQTSPTRNLKWNSVCHRPSVRQRPLLKKDLLLKEKTG